jgi:hypothetical protein
MPELVTIPLSFFELEAEYEKPLFSLMADRTALVQGIFEALQPWKPKIDDIEIRTAGKLSEQGFNFKIPLKRVSFFFGPSSCKLSRDDVNWGMAEETLTILRMVTQTLVQIGGVVLGKKKTTIGLHIQPKTTTFIEILTPFLTPDLAALEAQPLKTMAVVARWDKRTITLDGSVALANALFLKLEREFEGANSLEEIAHQLRTDERELLGVLGVEEEA